MTNNVKNCFNINNRMLNKTYLGFEGQKLTINSSETAF